MPGSLKSIKKIFIWIIINTALSVIIFAFKVTDSETPAVLLFIEIAIMTFIISTMSALTGYTTSRFLLKKPPYIEIPVVLILVLLAAFTGNVIRCLITNNLLNLITCSVFDHLILVLLIALTVTTLTIIIEHLNYKKENLERDLENITFRMKQEAREHSISIKEDEIHYLIKFDNLIYLSSHGKKTTLHTTEKDYAVNQLLKSIEEKLPVTRFIRVHKQFIINTDYLKHIKYYEGGRYIVHLNDEDESIIPVSRNIAPLLKERLGI